MSGPSFGRITARSLRPRASGENTKNTYGFLVRLNVPEQQMLDKVIELARVRLGGLPSHPVLLRELMQHYLGEKAYD